MIPLHQLKRGDVNPVSGLLFWKRNPAMRCGAEWLTAEDFDLRQKKMSAMRVSWIARNWERHSSNIIKYRAAHSKLRSAYATAWNAQNPERRKEIVRRYRSQNRTYLNALACDRQKRQLRIDPAFKLRKRLRARLQEALRQSGYKKSCRTMQIVGCSPQALRSYLEKQFKHGMTWANYGEWHIDHIVPLSSAKTQSDIERLSHFSNLQPLWAVENLSKGNR